MAEPNFRIESIVAYVGIDPEDNSEGIVGYHTDSGWIPMIGADEKRIESMRPMAEAIARESGAAVKLVRWGTREEVEVIGGN